jgi:hypothetical protein
VTLPVWCRFDAVSFQHVGHRGISDVAADIGQCSLDAIIAPRRILSGKPQNGIHDDLPKPRPSDSLSLIGVVPLLRHELTVPAEDRVGRHNGGQLQQCLAAESMAFHSQYAPLIIGQKHAFLAEFLQQRFDLVVLELDDPLLTFVHETSEGGQQDVPGLEKEGHGYRPKQPVSTAGE